MTHMSILLVKVEQKQKGSSSRHPASSITPPTQSHDPRDQLEGAEGSAPAWIDDLNGMGGSFGERVASCLEHIEDLQPRIAYSQCYGLGPMTEIAR